MTTDLQQAAARVQELIDIWDKGEIEVHPVDPHSPPRIKDCLRTLLGAVEEIERLRAEVAQLKAERDYANEHFGHLTQSVDHLITTFATTEHPDDRADAIKAVNCALYEFRKRAKRAGISMTTSAALADQTGGEG